MPEFIDLAQEIYHDQPVYHTHQKTVVWTDTSHEDTEHMSSDNWVRSHPSSSRRVGCCCATTARSTSTRRRTTGRRERPRQTSL